LAAFVLVWKKTNFSRLWYTDIRLISFELSEAFYRVVSNKNDPMSQVSLDLALLQYEAVFESSLWSQFASTLEKDQKDPFQNFINSQTINIK
jgi:hypothetical protein